jgi:hypothetical protein
VVNTVVTDPARGALGIGGALLGAPVYVVWRDRRRAGEGDSPLSDS